MVTLMRRDEIVGMEVQKGPDFPAGLARLCIKCGARELRSQPRSLLDRVLSRHRYKCAWCSASVMKVRQARVAAIVILLLTFATGAILYIWTGMRSSDKSADVPHFTEIPAREGPNAPVINGQKTPHKPKAVLDNATILRMVKANVEVGVIILMIKTSTPDFDLSANSVIELKQAGVDRQIITAMIEASN